MNFNKKAEITGRAVASKMDEILKSKDHAALFFGKTASDETAPETVEEEVSTDTNAVQEAFETILAMSEMFDDIGLEKTAAATLQLADNLIAEAAKKAKSKEDKKSDKKSEKKTLKDHMKSKKDDKKSDKKESKKDEKKSDKK